MFKMKKHRMKKNCGFTVIELLIFISISSIIMGATYSVFKSQQKGYKDQESIVDIQQNLRAGSFYLTNEIRLAGFSRAPGIIQAGPGVFHIEMDIWDPADKDNDTDTNVDNDGAIDHSGEEVIYTIVRRDKGVIDLIPDDADGDGFPDTLTDQGTPKPAILGRTDVFGSNKPEAIMENVEAFSLAYAFDVDDDGDDVVDRNAGGIIWAVDTDADQKLDTILDTNFDGVIDVDDVENGAALTPPVDIDRIRMVRMWMLVRSQDRDNQHTSQGTYVIGEKRLTVNDNFRRRLLTAAVVCRNMGE